MLEGMLEMVGFKVMTKKVWASAVHTRRAWRERIPDFKSCGAETAECGCQLNC